MSTDLIILLVISGTLSVATILACAIILMVIDLRRAIGEISLTTREIRLQFDQERPFLLARRKDDPPVSRERPDAANDPDL